MPKDSDGRACYAEVLFVNGRRARRARYPEKCQKSAVCVEQCANATARFGFVNRVRLTPDLVAVLAETPKEELPFAQLVAHIKWDTARYPIRSMEGDVVVLEGHRQYDYNRWTTNEFYFLENVRGAFRKEGDWFYDARAGEILYRPRKGERIKEAVIPRDGLETLVAIRGATNVVFENVTFAYSAPLATKGVTELESYQAAAKVTTAAVVIDRSKGIVFRNCRFEHIGSYGVWYREGCSDGGIFDCELTDLGAGGVRVGHFDTKKWRQDETSVTRGVTVDNCLIAHGGRFHAAGVGVLIAHASDCAVTHNDIFDLFYTGVSVGWVWGYAGSPAQRNFIAYNHIYDIGQSMLADMGGIYTLGTSFGTVLRGNVIHAIHTCSYGGWGLYPDEGSEGILLEDNLVYDTDDASFHQHYGRDNILRNNILVDSKVGQIAVTRAEPHRSLTATNNIILWTAGDAFNRYYGTKSEKTKIDWRANVWWRTDGREQFNGTSLAAWCQRVGDAGSVFSDPGFRDWKRRDFTLRADSPAVKLGFHPFDPSQAGRRK